MGHGLGTRNKPSANCHHWRLLDGRLGLDRRAAGGTAAIPGLEGPRSVEGFGPGVLFAPAAQSRESVSTVGNLNLP